MIDLKSLYGYRNDSPFRNSPYLDIQTPEGLIDMSNTPHDIYAHDGIEGRVLPAYSGLHKFNGKVVREIPMNMPRPSTNPFSLSGNLSFDNDTPKLGFNANYETNKFGVGLSYDQGRFGVSGKIKFKKGGLSEGQYMTQRGLRDGHNHGDFNNISPNKARQILHDKKVNGKPLTPEQYKLFGYLSKGNTLHLNTGGNPYSTGGYTAEQLYKYLFSEDEDEHPAYQEEKQLEETSQEEIAQREGNVYDEDNDMAMQIAMGDLGDNPYESAAQAGSIMGATAGGAGFRTYGTYEQGRQALIGQLELYKTGKTKNAVKPTSTLLQAMSVYAPKSDGNNPERYAKFIAERLGVSVNTPISALNTEQWARAIERMETGDDPNKMKGNNPGNIRK